MSLSSIATEIRLQIFSELLVLSEPIFIVNYGPPSSLLVRRQRDGLYPAILRVSRMMYLEACPLLYSNNRFQFPEVFSPFLRQIGSCASLIHYICVPFFTFDYPQPARAILHEAHVRDLQLIRDTCTSIQTLELLIPPEPYNYALRHSPIATETLDLLNTRLKSILSLKEIIVHFQEYPEGDASDDFMKMNNYGWAVKVTKLPKVWVSCDYRVEFDNEWDCNEYDEEQFRTEEERREREEEELWLDEYYYRSRYPYWKNDRL